MNRRCPTMLLVLLVFACRPAFASEAESSTALVEKGKSLLEKKDYDGAIAAFTEAIGLSPKTAVACCSRGLVREREGDKAKADADFKQAESLGDKPKQGLQEAIA